MQAACMAWARKRWGGGRGMGPPHPPSVHLSLPLPPPPSVHLPPPPTATHTHNHLTTCASTHLGSNAAAFIHAGRKSMPRPEDTPGAGAGARGASVNEGCVAAASAPGTTPSLPEPQNKQREHRRTHNAWRRGNGAGRGRRGPAPPPTRILGKGITGLAHTLARGCWARKPHRRCPGGGRTPHTHTLQRP